MCYNSTICSDLVEQTPRKGAGCGEQVRRNCSDKSLRRAGLWTSTRKMVLEHVRDNFRTPAADLDQFWRKMATCRPMVARSDEKWSECGRYWPHVGQSWSKSVAACGDYFNKCAGSILQVMLECVQGVHPQAGEDCVAAAKPKFGPHRSKIG